MFVVWGIGFRGAATRFRTKYARPISSTIGRWGGVAFAVKAALLGRLLTAKRHRAINLRKVQTPTVPMVADRTRQSVLRIEGDDRHFTKLALVVGEVHGMEAFVKFREDLCHTGAEALLSWVLSNGQKTFCGKSVLESKTLVAAVRGCGMHVRKHINEATEGAFVTAEGCPQKPENAGFPTAHNPKP